MTAPLPPMPAVDATAQLVLTAGLDVEAEGAYHRLRMLQWLRGALPADDRQLAPLLGLSSYRFRKVWPQIAQHYPLDGDVRRNPELAAARRAALGEPEPVKVALGVLNESFFENNSKKISKLIRKKIRNNFQNNSKKISKKLPSLSPPLHSPSDPTHEEDQKNINTPRAIPGGGVGLTGTAPGQRKALKDAIRGELEAEGIKRPEAPVLFDLASEIHAFAGYDSARAVELVPRVFVEFRRLAETWDVPTPALPHLVVKHLRSGALQAAIAGKVPPKSPRASPRKSAQPIEPRHAVAVGEEEKL